MAAPDARDRWLFGPVSDLLLGCGVAYVLIFGFLIGTGTPRTNEIVLVLSPFLVIFTGTPHYGATLLRVYEDASERRKYAFFAIWATVAVWGAFYASLYSALIGSVFLTLYLTWSPWHYSGQNYGIALMFLRRRGVEITPRTKRLIYASFTLSFLLTVLALHGMRGPNAEYAAVQPYQGGAYHLARIGIPSPWWEWIFGVVGVGYLAATTGAAVLLLRRASLRDIAPAFVLVGVQMLWFSLPPFARHWEIFGPESAFEGDGAAYAFMWVAMGHTVQYLWITTYYAARDGSYGRRILYLGRTLLAGSFIWSVPALMYTLSVEGGRFGGLARGPDVGVLLASAVNIHHFILDGAIWKLRDGRVARILVRREQPGLPEPIGPAGGRRWLATLVYAIGAVATLAVVSSAWVKMLELRPALQAHDLPAALRSLRHLDTLGHDEASDYRNVALLAGALGHRGEAVYAYERSLEKHPSTITYNAFGEFLYRSGSTAAAVEMFQRSLELDPYYLPSLKNLGLAWLQLGEPEQALGVLEDAAAIAPGDVQVGLALERARRRTGSEPPPPETEPTERESS